MNVPFFQFGSSVLPGAKTCAVSIFSAFLSASLISCGGSSGSASDAPFGTGFGVGSLNDSPTTTSSNINGGLTGRIITSVDEKPFEFDLATGRSGFIPMATVQDSLSANGDGTTNIGPVYFSGTANNGYIQTAEGCYYVPGDISQSILNSEDSCFAVSDENLEFKRFVRTRGIEVDGSLKKAPFGDLAAFSTIVRWISPELDGYRSIVSIFSTDSLEEITFFMQDEPTDFGPRSAPAFTWGPNGEFLFSGVENGRVRIEQVDPVTFSTVKTVLMGPAYGFRVVSMDLHPDGNKLLLQVGGSVVVLDLETGTTTKPVATNVGGFEGARWSPDGQWIMVVRWTATPLPVFDVNLQATVSPSSQSLYAIPANLTETVDLDADQLANVILIQSDRPDSPGSLTTHFPGFRALANAYFDWLP